MKKIYIVLFINIIISFTALSQEKYSLTDCYKIATENYPLNKSKELNIKLNEQKIENLKTVFLPSVSIDARASYQSDVMKIGVEFPMLPPSGQPVFPTPPYHNVYTELNIQQTIWDGGYSKQQKIIEEADFQVEIKNIEIEVNKLKEQILESYFLILNMEQQNEVISLSINSLKEQLKGLESAYKNGTSTEVNVLQLQAEIVKLEQKLIEIESGKKIAYTILYQLMGIEKEQEKEIAQTSINYVPNDSFTRYENELFSLQKTKIEAYSDLLSINQKPKVGAFAKLGYGNPGLNYFSGGWDTYYIAGVNFTWKFFDWNETNRKKQIFLIQKDLIDNKEETFNKNINTNIKKQSGELEKIEKLIEKDDELINMNKKIVENYNSQLQNGTITSSEYLNQWNKALIAEITKKIHELELEKVKAILELTMNNFN